MNSFYRERRRQRCRNYYQQHRAAILADKKHYYLQHRQHIIDAAKRWYGENKIVVKYRRFSKLWHEWYLQRKQAICAGQHVQDWPMAEQDRFWLLLHYHVFRSMKDCFTPQKDAARLNLEVLFS